MRVQHAQCIDKILIWGLSRKPVNIKDRWATQNLSWVIGECHACCKRKVNYVVTSWNLVICLMTKTITITSAFLPLAFDPLWLMLIFSTINTYTKHVPQGKPDGLLTRNAIASLTICNIQLPPNHFCWPLPFAAWVKLMLSNDWLTCLVNDGNRL